MKKQLPTITDKISRNGIYKFVSLGVAVVIWATTLSEKKDAILVRDMELEFLLRSNQQIVNSIDPHVQVKITGPKAALRRLSQTSRVVSVNLYQEATGPHEVEFSSRMLELPPNVRLLSVRPSRIKVDIEEANQK